MNWGLFLVLVGWLLPLALAVRIALEASAAGRHWRSSCQSFRIMVILLLLLPLTGKASSVVYLLTGGGGTAGQLQIGFMATPWGWTHFAATLVAVGGYDVLGPSVVAILDGAAPVIEPPAIRYLLRDLGIVAGCCFLGWIGAR